MSIELTIPDPPGPDPYTPQYGPWQDCSGLGQNPLAQIDQQGTLTDLVQIQTSASDADTTAKAKANGVTTLAGNSTTPATITDPIGFCRAVRMGGQTRGLTASVASTNSGGPPGPQGPAGATGVGVPSVSLTSLDPTLTSQEYPILQVPPDGSAYVISNADAFQVFGGSPGHAYPLGHTWNVALNLYDTNGTLIGPLTLASGSFLLEGGYANTWRQVGNGVLQTPITVAPGQMLTAAFTPGLLGGYTLYSPTFRLAP